MILKSIVGFKSDKLLTIKEVREKLGARFSRLVKSDKEVEREKEEKACAAFKK